MFNTIDHFCIPGTTVCEDHIGFSKDFLFVIDGASGLSGVNVTSDLNDSAWFADNLCVSLKNRLSENKEISDILKDITVDLQKQYAQFAREKNLIIPPDSPSASISVFRLKDNFLEYFGLGDCVANIQSFDLTIKTLRDDKLSKLDAIVISKMIQIHESDGVSILEARKQCTPMLMTHREKRNMPDGYWTLDLSGKGINHAKKHREKVNSVRSISLYSDGFSQLTNVFRIYSNDAALHAAIQAHTGEVLLESLLKMQEDDPDANAFPRFKFRDDISLIFAEVRPLSFV